MMFFLNLSKIFLGSIKLIGVKKKIAPFYLKGFKSFLSLKTNSIQRNNSKVNNPIIQTFITNKGIKNTRKITLQNK